MNHREEKQKIEKETVNTSIIDGEIIDTINWEQHGKVQQQKTEDDEKSNCISREMICFDDSFPFFRPKKNKVHVKNYDK